MAQKRPLQLALALLTAAIVASAGSLFVMHHTFMMNAQPMTHGMGEPLDCVSSIQGSNICNGVQFLVAPIVEKVSHQLTILPISATAVSLAAIFGLLTLSYLEPVLKRPPKLYLAYNVLRF